MCLCVLPQGLWLVVHGILEIFWCDWLWQITSHRVM